MQLTFRRHRPAPETAAPTAPRARRGRERGQVLVIFAGSIVLFMALLAVVADVSWYWANTLRVQRAADAAALAGAVYLPGDVAAATTAARAEARKNGYTHGTNATVSPAPDVNNDRQLNVQISAPVGTFFMRVLGITSIQAVRSSKAEYVLPVPMGSPQNYYGVGFLRDAIETTTTSTSSADGDTGWGDVPNTPIIAGGQWTNSTGTGYTIVSVVRSTGNGYAYETTNGERQRWGTFGLATTGGGSPIPYPAANQSVTIRGLEVRLQNAYLSASCSNSRISVDLSWDGGTSWSTAVATPNLGTTNTTDYTLPSSGGSSGTTAWGTHNWVRADFTDANFQARLTAVKGCATTAQLRVDMLEVRVYYTVHTTTTTTTTNMEDVDVVSPYGGILAPQNFWGAMQSQGAPNIQGDAYMTKYKTRKSLTNPDFLPGDYYNYAVEMPPGATGGEVWIFDPGMCDVRTQGGTGEYWTVGAPNGNDSKQPASAFYNLYDTQGTLYNDSDDGLPVASSGNTFAGIAREDHDIYSELGSSTSLADCADLAWHYDANDWQSGSPTTPRRGWYQLASGLSGGPAGRTYRLHTNTAAAGQDDTTALNAFAIWATASATPRVYGLGAMEAYVRLPGGTASEFYLAQIDAVHAGKTMEIRLWDPGDTGALSASLQILAPGATDYTPVTFSHSAESGNPSSSSCASYSSSGTTAVTTNTGGSSRYNGCWLTIEITIPTSYTAPHPTTDTVTGEAGWWKIRYSMGGSSSDYSTDLTTWEVSIRGNPVHLKVP